MNAWDGSGRTPADYDHLAAAKEELASYEAAPLVDHLDASKVHALISIAESLARMAPLTAEQELAKRAAAKSIRDALVNWHPFGDDAA